MTVTITEQATMPRKKPEKQKPAAIELPVGRIELQAEPAWIEALDAAAKALGVSRSAYIRMACNRQMAADKREFPREG